MQHRIVEYQGKLLSDYSLSVYKLSISAIKVAYKLDSASSVRTSIETILEIIHLAEVGRTIPPEI